MHGSGANIIDEIISSNSQTNKQANKNTEKLKDSPSLSKGKHQASFALFVAISRCMTEKSV